MLRHLLRRSRGEGVFWPWTLSSVMGEYHWKSDSAPIREFVGMLEKDGWMTNSIYEGRCALMRFERFVRDTAHVEVDHAGWREYLAYKTHLIESGKQRATVNQYLKLVAAYYRLRYERLQPAEAFDTFRRVWSAGRFSNSLTEHRPPMSPDTLKQVMSTAYRAYRWGSPDGVGKEDYPLLMTLLYTGGRSQFYGLRVREVDFEKMEIRTIVKAGRPLTIPLHPELAKVLREHLARRPYRSEFVFRYGKDNNTYNGHHTNRAHALWACKRVQRAAHLEESIYPARFRVTVANLGRRLGLDPQVVPAILGHRNLSLTLDVYSRVAPDEARQAFSKIDLTRDLDKLAPNPRPESTEALLRLIPKDKAEAVNTILRGLIELMQTMSPDSRGSVPEVFRLGQVLMPEPKAKAPPYRAASSRNRAIIYSASNLDR